MQKIGTMNIDHGLSMAKPCSSNIVLLRKLMLWGLLLFISVFIVTMQLNILPINQIQIEGDLKQLNQNHLKALVMHEVQNGFFRVKPHKIRDLLVALPWVKEASVYKVWPDRIKIIVHEQIAFARWGNDGLLNLQGEYFEIEELSAEHQSLTLLQGVQAQQKILFEYLKQLTQVYNFNVARLCMGVQCPLEFELDSGLIVRLGRKDFDLHIKRFNHVFIDMQEKLRLAKKIDMRYPNGFAIAWRINKSGK